MTQRIVNYTYGTGNPVLPDGSIDVRDGVDNLQSFDVFMNAEEDEYNQRDGVISPTVRGAIKALGPVVTAWTFTTGGKLNYPNEAALNPANGNYYGWTGAFPKVVAPGTNPAAPGSGYVPRTDVVLQDELASDSGATHVQFKPSGIANAIKRGLDDVIYDQIIDVKWFGAVGDWNAATQTGTDDTAAMQAAITHFSTVGTKRAGGTRAIRFPYGNYKFSSLLIPAAMGFGIDFIGDGKTATTIWADPSDTNPAITSEVEFVNFRSMSLFGSLSETSNTANWKVCFYKGKLASNRADIDVHFSDCLVGYATDFVQAYGRGVIFDCGTAAVYCANLLNIVCDPSTVFTGSTNDTLYTGMRHYSFLGMRADVVSRLVKITGTAAQKDHIHGIQMVGCDFAACDRLIEGVDATICGAVLCSNESLGSFADGVVTVKSVTNSHDIGNKWRNLHSESVAPSANADCIRCVWDISGAAAGLSIIGANASNIRSFVVRTGAASTSIQIKDCQFPQFATFSGLDNYHYVYYSTENCVGLQITGNQFTASTVAGTYKLYDESIQTSSKTIARDNTAPFTWADHRLRYTPALLVGGVASVPVVTPSYYARVDEITQNHVTVDVMITIDPKETSGVLSISLPSAFPAIAENVTISGGYSGGGVVNQASGFSGTTAPFAPIRVNPATQQAEIWLATGPSGTQANASHTNGVIALFCSFRYRYA